MSAQKPTYYITTPIYYVNAAPHLGTAYCTMLCDVQARFRRAAGYEVKFLTGMDEHGQKVAEAAEAHGMSPQEWCDAQAPLFQELWRQLEISNDDFIRTTEQRQNDAVQYLWERMLESGYLYKDNYDGWYCVPEETYFTGTQVEKADELRGTPGAHLCPDCGRPLERRQEESYFFRLSAFQDRLLAHYDEHPDFVRPDFRMNEVRSFVESGLQDTCVSRTTFDWGIPVPFDDKHVTYVWFDALLNYMTAVGYGLPGEENAATYRHLWPAQVHMIGKDIIRFHCILWPAMLMAIGEPLPEQVFAHGFLMVKNEAGEDTKMSKSLGNAIAPQDVIDFMGVEGYRYYFMTDVHHGEDSGISFGRMEQVYNADLANSWGNLVSRALNMSAKYFGGLTPELPQGWAEKPGVLHDLAEGVYGRYFDRMAAFDYAGGKDEAMALVRAANHYIEDSAPWAVAKDPARAGELVDIIASLLETIRIVAHLLAPFMPQSSAEVLRRLSLADEAGTDDLERACAWGGLVGGVPVTKGEALFPRIESGK